MAGPGGYGRIPKDCRPCQAGHNLLEQLQPFSAQIVFELQEACDVAARPCQAIDEAGADRSATAVNTIGRVRVACNNGAMAAVPLAKMTSGASATNYAACLRILSALPAPQR